MQTEQQVLILGIGNLLWADEGFGIRAVQTLNNHYEFPDSVTLMDGGTQGIYLLHYIQRADALIVFDAIDYGLPPGTMKLVEGDEVPAFMGAKKMSLHQTGFQEVLAMAQLTGQYPARLLLVGVQPVELDDYGGSLRPAVKAQIAPAVAAAIDYLQALGIQPVTRMQPLSHSELTTPELALDNYEGERPSEEDACRVGDERFLQRGY